MARTIDAATLTEMGNDVCTVGVLVDLEFDSVGAGTVSLTDVPGGITVGTTSYTGAGHLLSVSDIEEAASVTVGKVTVTLSGVQSSNVSLVLAQHFRDRPLTISLVYLDSSMVVVGDPIQIFHGPMDVVQINEQTGATVTVSVTASNKFVNFTMPRGRHTSNDEQQALFPGDAIFEYAGRQNLNFVWGGGSTDSGDYGTHPNPRYTGG